MADWPAAMVPMVTAPAAVEAPAHAQQKTGRHPGQGGQAHAFGPLHLLGDVAAIDMGQLVGHDPRQFGFRIQIREKAAVDETRGPPDRQTHCTTFLE